ncbi:hypothetical protein [Kitasatospora sp. NPDC057223]|uniref:hypothetical protein n=1 Tax=Kitasatospora sp. NPDC057223 TaxID=3346055 RepID=UPI0036343F76
MNTSALATAPAPPVQLLIAGARWLASQTRDPEKTWTAWNAGAAVPVPVGRSFAVVRVLDERLGRATFHLLLRRQPQFLGPVIANHSLNAVEFLAPALPAVWQGPGTAFLDGSRESTRMVKCPPPNLRAAGRDWLYAPRAGPGREPVLTDAFQLAGVLNTARAQLLRAGHCFAI